MVKNYNENSMCPKCNNEYVRTEYDEYHDMIRRTCQRCNYTWVETPSDKIDTIDIK